MRTIAYGLVTLTLLSIAAAAPGGDAATVTRAAGKCRLPHFGAGVRYHPHVVADRFGPHITNSWYPLRPGTTYIYTGTDEGKPSIDVMVVTHKTRVIDGVRTRVVADQVLTSGLLAERTRDYFAQDDCGNVWYFGEDTATLDRRGHVVDREGTWHAGIDRAQPGVFMQAHPRLDRRFRQEWYRGQAADTFVVRDLSTPVSAPIGKFRHAVRTEETSSLEPDVVDNKYYVQGIGEVRELTVKGGHEVYSLVEVLR